jgi:hypothetical protein
MENGLNCARRKKWKTVRTARLEKEKRFELGA